MRVLKQVGWVQRSETHRDTKGALRCRCTHPTNFSNATGQLIGKFKLFEFDVSAESVAVAPATNEILDFLRGLSIGDYFWRPVGAFRIGANQFTGEALTFRVE